MKLAIIGATGFVGPHILNEALQRGHKVTAIVRSPEKVTTQNENLTVIKGDVFNATELAEQLANQDVVLSAFNPGWTNPNIYNDFLKGSQHIIEATKKSGTKRLLVVGGAGSLYVAPNLQAVDTEQFPAEWKPGALAARDLLNILKENQELDWTFLSPAMNLHPGKRTGVFRLGNDEPVFNEKGECAISVEDLAVALINEAEQSQFIRKRFTVGY